MAKRRSRPHYIFNLGLSVLVLGVFSLAGARVVGTSVAATANPYGYADYCALESNVTVIYGWASDPNASTLAQPSVTVSAGGKAVTAATNRAGYRDAWINSWIDRNRAGDPKPGTYGFRAAISGLYKGSQHTLTGTILNEGPGSSVILTINNSNYTDGDTSKPYFAGNVIPQGCLADAPSTPTAPTPPPPSRPTPPPPTGGGSGSGRPTPPATPTAPVNGPSNAADASVTVGTLAATVKIPADGATRVAIIYGSDPNKLDQTTPDQPVEGDSATILLSGLDPQKAYTYQLVRKDEAGHTVNSASATFNTLGFVIALHLVDNQGKGIQGIATSLSGQKSTKTSDENGNVRYDNVSSGSYTATYTYKNKKYAKQITANPTAVSAVDAAAAKVVTVNLTINVQREVGAVASTKTTQKESPLGIIIPIVLAVIALVLAIIGYTRRRRKRQHQDYYEDYPAAPLPEYQPPAPAVTPINDKIKPLPAEMAEHTGLSLKEMVLRSMAEEAKRRELEDKQK